MGQSTLTKSTPWYLSSEEFLSSKWLPSSKATPPPTKALNRHTAATAFRSLMRTATVAKIAVITVYASAATSKIGTCICRGTPSKKTGPKPSSG